MYYALRRRMGEEQPTILYEEKRSFLFCSAGVLIIPKSHGFRFKSRVWTIIDSIHSPQGFPREIHTALANVFPIYLTSPRRYVWSKPDQFRMHRAIMNPWTRAEVVYV